MHIFQTYQRYKQTVNWQCCSFAFHVFCYHELIASYNEARNQLSEQKDSNIKFLVYCHRSASVNSMTSLLLRLKKRQGPGIISDVSVSTSSPFSAVILSSG